MWASGNPVLLGSGEVPVSSTAEYLLQQENKGF